MCGTINSHLLIKGTKLSILNTITLSEILNRDSALIVKDIEKVILARGGESKSNCCFIKYYHFLKSGRKEKGRGYDLSKPTLATLFSKYPASLVPSLRNTLDNPFYIYAPLNTFLSRELSQILELDIKVVNTRIEYLIRTKGKKEVDYQILNEFTKDDTFKLFRISIPLLWLFLKPYSKEKQSLIRDHWRSFEDV